MNETQSSTRNNIWVVSTLFFAILFVVSATVIVYNLQHTYSKPIASRQPRETTQPIPTVIPTIQLQEQISFPSSATYLTEGSTWIHRPYDVLRDKYFKISIRNSYQDTIETYTIPLLDIDSITDLKISHLAKNGCVTVQSSGYIGYYIFKLPNGQKIAQGKQYSACIEWIDSDRVIINERLYDEQVSNYYLFDTTTQTKQLIGNYDTSDKYLLGTPEPILTTTTFENTCTDCPLYSPPRPGWCDDGVVVVGERVAYPEKKCSCINPPACKRN